MKIATKGVVALAAAIALGLSACAPGGGDPTGENTEPTTTNTELAQTDAQYNPQPRENIQDGGTLTTAITEITDQFNTFHADGTRYTLDVWQWYNPVLALYTAGGEWSFNDDYLTDVTMEEVDGNTVVTYTLREDITFNDGTPIDWRAFEAAWKTSTEAAKEDGFLPSSTDGYNRITSVEPGEGDYQAVVTFDGIWTWWQGLFNYVLHPDAVVDAETYNEAYLTDPHNEWGAGPYQVKSYDPNAGVLVFERNPKWWGDKGKLDERIFQVMEDQASLNAFRNGQIDATGVGNKERYTQVEGMADIEIRQSATPSWSLVMLNGESPILTDVKVRQAVFKAIDRETMLKIRYDGMNYSEKLPGSFSLFPFQPGYVDNVAEAGIAFDAEGAKALLDEAGWAMGDGEFRQKDGEELKLLFPSLGDDAVTKNLASALQQMMKDVGINLEIDSRPSEDFSDVYNNREFDLFMMGFAASDPFGPAYFCQVWCSDSGLNVSRTGTEEIDNEIAEASKIADADEQTAAFNPIEVKAFQQAGILPLWNGPTMVAVKTGLANFGADLFYVGKPQDIGWEKE